MAACKGPTKRVTNVDHSLKSELARRSDQHAGLRSVVVVVIDRLIREAIAHHVDGNDMAIVCEARRELAKTLQ